MIVETIRRGECTIVIHDDAYIRKTPEEIERVLRNVSGIVYASQIKRKQNK